jgi:hypothetical protein
MGLFNVLSKLVTSGTKGLAEYRAMSKAVSNFTLNNIGNKELRAAISGFGTSSMLQRGALAGGYLGGSVVANTLIDIGEERLRSYYGNETYDREIGGGASSLKTAASLLGLGSAFSAVLGKDIISRSINSYSFNFGKGRHAAKLLGKYNSSNTISQLDHISKEISFRQARLKRRTPTADNPTGFKRPLFHNDTFKGYDANFMGPVSPRHSRHTALRKDYSIDKEKRIISDLQSARRNVAFAARAPRLDIINPIIRGVKGEDAPAYAAARGIMGVGRLSFYGGMIGLTGLVGESAAPILGIAGVSAIGVSAIGKKFIKNPYGKNFSGASKTNKLLGKAPPRPSTNITVDDPNYNPKDPYGYSAFAEYTYRKFMQKEAGYGSGIMGSLASSLGFTIAGVGGGIALGIGTNEYKHTFAEGDITSMDQRSTTQRLNYSTAGLVQALHNNSRRF